MEDSQLIGPVSPLAGVLESIDREAVVVAPGTTVTDQAVCDCVVWDPLEELPSAVGGVLLLVGASVMHPQLGSLLVDAGEAGYVAAVIKRRGQDLTGIVETARRAGLIMLVATDELPWSTVEALLAGAIATCATTVRRAGFEATDDLFGMANAIASITAAAVTIEDLERRVLAYSSIEGQAIDAVRQDSILDRKVQAIPEYDAEYLAVARAEGHVWFPSQADHELARVVVPVRIGGRLLGSIWAIDDGEPGSANRAVAALEMAAPAVALAIMSTRFREDAARRRRSEQLAAQLGATGSDHTSTLRDRLPLAIMGFGPLTDAPDLDEQHLTQIIRLNVERLSPEAACARVEDRQRDHRDAQDDLARQRPGRPGPALFGAAHLLAYSRSFQTIPLLIVASIWYLVVTTILTIIQFYIERRFARGDRSLPPTPLQRVRTFFRTHAPGIAGRTA